jgi:hypothetical protein
MYSSADMEKFYCGDPEASQAFYERNKPVIAAVTNAHDCYFGLLKEAQKRLDGQEKTVIWLLAVACLKEFDEILLLSGNGFGTGAVKLMRPFYERTVTLSYLASHTDQIQRFIDYSYIHWHKLLVEAEEIHSNFKLSEEDREVFEENYNKTKGEFRQEDCKKCHSTRLQMSWTKLDMKTMASNVNEDLRRLCANAYLAPTLHLHTTFWGITNQSEKTPSGKFDFMGGNIQEEAAQESFEQAYLLLTQTLDVLNGFFELDQKESIQQLGKNWLLACETAWDRPAKDQT